MIHFNKIVRLRRNQNKQSHLPVYFLSAWIARLSQNDVSDDRFNLLAMTLCYISIFTMILESLTARTLLVQHKMHQWKLPPLLELIQLFCCSINSDKSEECLPRKERNMAMRVLNLRCKLHSEWMVFTAVYQRLV